MKLLRLLVLALFLAAAGPALADESLATYRVPDVAVDVGADNAAQARDKAISQAQRLGFEQLLVRLGAEGAKAAKVSDDGIAAMVKAFEVQKEHAGAKRYTGTFTVQFKPEAVRHFLDQKGVAFTEARAQPVVVLPIWQGKERAILWEDRNPWRDAWDEVGKSNGLVPFIVPAGDLDDIAKIGTNEALEGKGEGLQAVAQKYEAGAVLVAVLKGDLTPNKAGQVEGAIEAYQYDATGQTHEPIKGKLGPAVSGKALDEAYRAAVKHVTGAVEAAWREHAAAGQAAGTPPSASVPPAAAGAAQPSPTIIEAPAPLSVNVPVPTLAAWAQIRNKLAQTPGVVATTVATMTRGLVHIELQYRGDLATLQTNLEAKSLRLEQTGAQGWSLVEEAPSSASPYR